MSRRNFILLIIVLMVIGILFFYFAFFVPTPVQDGEEDTGFFANLNPFGKTTIVPPKETPTYTTPTPDNIDNGSVKQKLTKVSTMPIAGYTVFLKEKVEKEFYPAIRYVDRATGNIYQTFADDIFERKFSNTTIPKVYEALFGENGGVAIMRYLNPGNTTIRTFVGKIPEEVLGGDTESPNEIIGTFLPDNISDLSLSPNETKIFYLIDGGNSVSGITMNLKDNKKTQVFDSPFTEWLSSWSGENAITLTTKASGSALGYVYGVDVSKKNVSKIIGDIAGLTSLPSKDGKIILFTDNNLSLNTYDIKTGAVQSLGLRTLAEKCVWSNGSITVYCAIPKSSGNFLYPDSWYQGEVSLNDQIWQINLSTLETNLILDPITMMGGEEIDAIKLSLDKNEDYLFFVNKKDSFLWKFDLK